MKESYQDRIEKAKFAINEADCVIIGGGAGLSSAVGLLYSGNRFTDNFAEFIKKYGMTDMYSAGFYPFSTQEEKWAYWSKHVVLNRYEFPVGKIYSDLLSLVTNKDYFVITTNVDYQFYKAGFDKERIFAVQGDYGKFQCAKACHNKLYDNEQAIRKMVASQCDCKIPTALVPKCPVCGGEMDLNIRKDIYFVEDDNWKWSSAMWENYVSDIGNRKIVLLELGVGYNTPSIIKFPFEQITAQCNNATLIRINKDYPEISKVNEKKTIAFDGNMEQIIKNLLQ